MVCFLILQRQRRRIIHAAGGPEGFVPPGRIREKASIAPVPAASAENAAPAVLGTELTGDLRCARCAYNLRGLSVRGNCPECGTPIAATLLVVIDPQAAEVQRIAFPRVTASGLAAWAWGGLGAAVVVWMARLGEAFPGVHAYTWHPGMAAILLAVSAAGGLALVRPHGGVPRTHSAMSLAGVAASLAVAWITWHLLAVVDGPHARPFLSGTEWSDRWAWSMGSTILVGIAALGYHPMFTALQARSHLLRSGHVERQTMRAVIASIGVVMCGDAAQALIRATQPSATGVLVILAACITGVGSLLLTAGLVGVVMDVSRLVPVVLSPPLGLKDVLGSPGDSGAEARPSHAPGEAGGGAG